jgi:negative regulator of sigma E activity
MSQTQDLRLTTELLAAYLEGEVAASERVAIEALLREDPRARRRLEQLRHIASSLAAPVPELESIDLAARVRAELARPPTPARRRVALLPWATVLAAAACVGLFVTRGLAPQPEQNAEFRAKSAGSGLSDAQRWAGVQVHRAVSPTSLEALGPEMRADDGLLFSYTNIGPQPFPYLMIFGVDASGEVRWFYPTYEQAGTNPQSVAIEPRSHVSLGDVIGHDYAPGPLVIHALFTRQPLHVSEVEGWLRDKPNGFEQSPVEDASLQVVRVRVVR